jgi:hypothetical protein
LVWTPITGPSNPDAASDVDKDDETKPILPSKRKRESNPANTSQHGRGVHGLKTSNATTKTLEKEKLCLKEIDTSKKDGNKQFFTKTRYWIFSGYPPTFLLWTPLLCESFLGVQQEERKKSQEEG